MIHVLCGQSDRFNLTHAQSYGSVMFHENAPSPFDTDAFFKYIEQLDFGADDYLALTGPVVNVAMAALMIGLCSETEIQLLLFDARNDRYVVRKV